MPRKKPKGINWKRKKIGIGLERKGKRRKEKMAICVQRIVRRQKKMKEAEWKRKLENGFARKGSCLVHQISVEEFLLLPQKRWMQFFWCIFPSTDHYQIEPFFVILESTTDRMYSTNLVTVFARSCTQFLSFTPGDNILKVWCYYLLKTLFFNKNSILITKSNPGEGYSLYRMCFIWYCSIAHYLASDVMPSITVAVLIVECQCRYSENNEMLGQPHLFTGCAEETFSFFTD